MGFPLFNKFESEINIHSSFGLNEQSREIYKVAFKVLMTIINLTHFLIK